MTYTREVWTRLETLHAVTYFAPESRAAATETGLKGYWMGYFGFRAAPLGPVPPGVVEAAFFNFAPRKVQRAVPDVWGFAPPDRLLPARAAAAAAALRRAAPEVDAVAARVIGPLAAAVAAGKPDGRVLFAANRDLPAPADPVEALWQAATALREHRGDGHVALLTAAGVSGLEAHLLIATERGIDPTVIREARGWTAGEWDAAGEALRSRGLLDGAGLTTAGAGLRVRVEADTDRLAAGPYEVLADDVRAALLADLSPVADAVVAAGLIPHPNPMGLRPPA